MKLMEIAHKLDCQLEGDGEMEITGVTSLERAAAGDLSFLSNRKYVPLLATTKAGAVLLAKDFGPVKMAALRSNNPYLAFAKALELFYQPPRPPSGVHPTAVIAPSARVGANASIGPYVVIEDDVEIGANATLRSHVV